MKSYQKSFVLVMASLLLFAASSFAAATEQRVEVKTVVGKVEVRSGGGAWREARIGMPVKTGWDIRTYVESTVDLLFENGTELKINENSVVTLSALIGESQKAGGNSQIKVATGQIMANVKKLTNQNSKFEFETPTAVASIRGTRIGLNVDKDGTALDVYEGLVMFRPNGSDKAVPVSINTRALIRSGSTEIKLQQMSEKSAEDSTKQSAAADSTAPAPATDSTGAAALTPATDSTSMAALGKNPDSTSTATPALATTDTTSKSTTTTLTLTTTSPAANAVVADKSVQVKGIVTKGSQLSINGKDATVAADGSFSVSADLALGRNTIPLNARLGDQTKTLSLTVEYRPRLTLAVNGITNNMELNSADLQLQVNVSEGAKFSVNGTEGETRLTLNPGSNTVLVRAYDAFGGSTERTFIVNFKQTTTLTLRLTTPTNGQIFSRPLIPVSGATVAGAEVTVNGTSVSVSSGGVFNYSIPIPDEKQDYTVTVVARSGSKEMTEERAVSYIPSRAPLTLVIATPSANALVRQSPFRVTGKTTAGAKVTVNGATATVAPTGNFSADVQFTERQIGSQSIEIVASDEETELAKTVSVIVDAASPIINTSKPVIVVTGLGQRAVRTGKLLIQAADQTPEDQITVVISDNSSRDQEVLDPGGRIEYQLLEGKNAVTIRATDRAGNPSNVITGTIYNLPQGKLTIDILEPDSRLLDIRDLPPMPRDVSIPRLPLRIEISDGIGNIPESIKYCRVAGNGETILLRSNGTYVWYGDAPLRRGVNSFVITAEDYAENIISKTLVITIR